ncbi:MAG: hypothetical protein M3Q70_00635 [bacterium]|nr:hypothetical protein [bacterium]
MQNFENIVEGVFNKDELALFSIMVDNNPITTGVEPLTSCGTTDDRVAAFTEAHRIGYSLELYKTMLNSGFKPRYLSYISSLGCLQLGKE